MINRKEYNKKYRESHKKALSRNSLNYYFRHREEILLTKRVQRILEKLENGWIIIQKSILDEKLKDYRQLRILDSCRKYRKRKGKDWQNKRMRDYYASKKKK